MARWARCSTRRASSSIAASTPSTSPTRTAWPRCTTDYVRAGADVIETNTFGANRIKLRAFGLADQMRDINRAGARLARKAAGEQRVRGRRHGPARPPHRAVGQDRLRRGRGVLPRTGRGAGRGRRRSADARDVPRRQRDRAAIAAVRSVCPLPIVAQMTIEDEGNSLDGTPPEQFVPALQAAGADVIGINCSIGPAHMLEALERMAASHAGAAVGAAQRRPAARHRRAHAVSDLARIHGVVRAAIHRRARPPRWRLLRHDTRAHHARSRRRSPAERRSERRCARRARAQRARGHADRPRGEVLSGQRAGAPALGHARRARAAAWSRQRRERSSRREPCASRASMRCSFLTVRPGRGSARYRWPC